MLLVGAGEARNTTSRAYPLSRRHRCLRRKKFPGAAVTRMPLPHTFHSGWIAESLSGMLLPHRSDRRHRYP
jgi:hypothetical protein